MMNLHIKILTLILLLSLWLGLNGFHYEFSRISFLIIASLVSYLLAIYMGIIPKKMKLKINFIFYFFWLIKEIIKSTIDIIKIIWRKNMNLSETMEWIDPDNTDETYLVIYGNSITLTPGTVTLDIKSDMLLVHALKHNSIEELKKGEMRDKIKKAMNLQLNLKTKVD